MRLTLQELNELPWYRFLKVTYTLLYIILFAAGCLFVKEISHEQSPIKLPKTATEAFQDENFYLLPPNEMISVLRLIDDDFNGLPDSEQIKVISEIKEIEKKHKKGKGVYVYQAIDTINIKNAILATVMCLMSIVAFMEVIRRSFYYVVVGELFPKVMSLNKIRDYQ